MSWPLKGNKIFVRPAIEILGTLDENGTLDGLPFMPEMLSWCGKMYEVQRQVHKTCVDGHPIRQFVGNDVVVLKGPRCDGSAHDGCKHGCRVYWKAAWLRPAEEAASDRVEDEGVEILRARLKSKSDENHYFCQSTQLYAATNDFASYGQYRRAQIAVSEIAAGDLSRWRALQLFLAYSWQKILRRLGCDNWLRGPNKRAPAVALNLLPGERVRIKSREEIVQTLDHKLSNRGLTICYEMMRCCGRESEVRYRVDRLINERTGLMREIANTVTLSDVGGCGQLHEECLCYGEPGDCPRGELMYWREIWLERVNP